MIEYGVLNERNPIPRDDAKIDLASTNTDLFLICSGFMGGKMDMQLPCQSQVHGANGMYFCTPKSSQKMIDKPTLDVLQLLCD
jgi:hypothetical protein